jgi:phenol 2-monooxygenase
MNVSMADALDLSWKLSHVLHGLSSNPQALLESFAIERYANASLLIDMDKKWYAEKYMRHLQTRASTSPPAEAIGVEIWNFVLGLTIEYDEGYLVERRGEAVVKGTNYVAGNLREGRRVADTVLVRYADANRVHMQDVLAIDGKFHIVMFASRSFKGPNSVLWTAMERVRTEFAPRYPRGSAQGLIVLPEVEENVDWSIFPEVVRERIEMEVLCASDGTYAFYGIDPEEGAMVIVRPDQFVGTIVGPGDVDKMLAYFDRVLVQV